LLGIQIAASENQAEEIRRRNEDLVRRLGVPTECTPRERRRKSRRRR
jgi:hypothetical protein